MSDQGIATRDRANGSMLMEQVVIKGDLKDLTPEQRVEYYQAVCRSLSINPLTQPFQYITLSGRLTLYATRACTDQLRAIHKVTAQIVGREHIEDVYIVTARVTGTDGRSDEAIGAVTIGNLKGDALANALMKAETKAKRRATLSLVGLGWLDETEVETIPGARVQSVETPALPAPSAFRQAFEPESIEGEAYSQIAEEDKIPPAVRQAGSEAVGVFVMLRKSLRKAATLEALGEEWKAVNTYLKSAGLPAVVTREVTVVKDACKAQLTGQIAAF